MNIYDHSKIAGSIMHVWAAELDKEGDMEVIDLALKSIHKRLKNQLLKGQSLFSEGTIEEVMTLLWYEIGRRIANGDIKSDN
jgi:hypothetical protein